MRTPGDVPQVGLIGTVGQSMGWSQTVAAVPGFGIETADVGRGPTPARPVVCVSTLMKL